MLALLRACSSITRGVISQWQLVHVCLGIVRECSEAMWINAFKVCVCECERGLRTCFQRVAVINCTLPPCACNGLMLSATPT